MTHPWHVITSKEDTASSAEEMTSEDLYTHIEKGLYRSNATQERCRSVPFVRALRTYTYTPHGTHTQLSCQGPSANSQMPGLVTVTTAHTRVLRGGQALSWALLRRMHEEER